MIQLNNVTISYNNSYLINNFSLSIEYGEIIGFYGPTGCGKTSLLNYINNKYSNEYKISYAFQDNRLISELSALENVMLPIEKIYGKDMGKKIALEYLTVFDLKDKSGQKVNTLSGGELQRVNLARAFAWDGDLYLLDEPFSAQDIEHKKKIIKYIKEKINDKKIFIIVSHNKQDFEDLECKIIDL